MYKRLYIIGNGFDLHYGLETSLEKFGHFARSQDEPLASGLESLFTGDLWGHFERALGWLSPDDVAHDHFGLLSGIDKASNGFDEAELAAWSYHLEAMQEVLNWRKVNELFVAWVDQVSVPAIENDGVVLDDAQTCYLTFNYTDTLEKAFGVDPGRILHIHGLVGGSIVVGHAPVDGGGLDRVDFNYHEEWEIEELRQKFLKASVKPVSRIIALNEGFFRELSGVEEVVVAGFGFWKVDEPYISRIRDALPPCSRWKVYCHSAEDRKRALECIPDSGLISFAEWPSLRE